MKVKAFTIDLLSDSIARFTEKSMILWKIRKLLVSNKS